MPEATKNVLPGIFACYKITSGSPNPNTDPSDFLFTGEYNNSPNRHSHTVPHPEPAQRREEEKKSQRNPYESKKFLLIPRKINLCLSVLFCFRKFKSLQRTEQNCTLPHAAVRKFVINAADAGVFLPATHRLVKGIETCPSIIHKYTVLCFPQHMF